MDYSEAMVMLRASFKCSTISEETYPIDSSAQTKPRTDWSDCYNSNLTIGGSDNKRPFKSVKGWGSFQSRQAHTSLSSMGAVASIQAQATMQNFPGKSMNITKNSNKIQIKESNDG